MFKNLFSPITINKLEIKNRIVYPSLAVLFSYDQKINDKHIEFYRERAKGGAGIVTVGPVGIDELGSGILAMSLAHDEAIPSFKKLAEAINQEGARSWVQLFHAGAYSMPIMINNKTPMAPSAVYSNYSKTTPQEMTIDDIKQVQMAFVRAALRAKEAGINGVELLGSAGYLITQFWSPLTNQRTDIYGGSFENRSRFVTELIQLMRDHLGKDFPITIRMAGNDFVPGSNTSSETLLIAQVYEEAGINAINVTGGWHESKVPQLSMDVPRGAFSYLASAIKKHVTVPVYASNRITDPFTAEQIINDDMADLVCIGRGLIADPYFPQKAQAGEVDEIRPCVSCSQGCTDQIFSGKPVFCIGNARAGFESTRNLPSTTQPRKVMIIGAGPAGLEAAVRAAEMGHTVLLFEKDHMIGGQLNIAGMPPHKEELWELCRYYMAMIEKYNIELYLETEVDRNLIAGLKPDYIIAAEGAEQAEFKPAHCDNTELIAAWDVLKDDPKLGKNIAIIGGGPLGIETAAFLAAKGTISPETLEFIFKYNAETMEAMKSLILTGTKKITIFELLPRVGEGIGKSTKWIVLNNLQQYGVDIINEANILSINNNTITYDKQGSTYQVQFDSIVYATGVKPVRTIVDSLEATGIPYSVIGDSKEPGKIHDAIHQGFLASLDIF